MFLLQSRTSQSVSFVNKHVSAVSSVSVFAVLICKCKGSTMYSSVFRYTNTWIGHASRLSAALKWRPLRLGPRMCYCSSSQQQSSTCCSQSDSWGPRESNEIEWFCFLNTHRTHCIYSPSSNEFLGLKVYIFWEGHKILRNLHLTFVLCSASQK